MTSRASTGSRTRVGRYELGRTLGEGNFAKVKFARNVETGENFAIKILDKEKLLKHKMIGQVNFENFFYITFYPISCFTLLPILSIDFLVNMIFW